MNRLNPDKFVADNPEWRKLMDLVVQPPTITEAIADFSELSDECDLARRGDEYIQPHVTRLAFYWRLRVEGQEHRWSEMCALQSPPRAMTDDVFFEGMKFAGDDMPKDMLNNILKASARHNFKPPPGANYYSQLARFQGDPEAWVSRSDGRQYIRKLCEKRGWGCEGGVEVAHRQPERDPHEAGPKLAEDLVQKRMKEATTRDPSLVRKSRKELRESIIAKHGAK
jgi:hypothetical protein